MAAQPATPGKCPYGDRNTANKFGGRGPGGAGGAGGVGGAGRPGGLAVRAALVVPEDPVELAVRAALVVPEDPVELAVQVALVVPESPAVLVALVVRAVRGALVVSENPAVPVALELELVQVEAELVRGHPRARLAVALRTKSVIAAHRPDLVPLLAAGEDLAAAVAETTREPAAAEAVKHGRWRIQSRWRRWRRSQSGGGGGGRGGGGGGRGGGGGGRRR